MKRTPTRHEKMGRLSNFAAVFRLAAVVALMVATGYVVYAPEKQSSIQLVSEDYHSSEGLRVVNSKDQWTANAYVDKTPLRAKLGQKFNVEFEVLQSTDADVVQANDPDALMAQGVIAIAASEGIKISGIETHCYKPGQDGAADGCDFGEKLDPIDLSYQDTSYEGYALLPYKIPRNHSATFTVTGTYVSEGDQGVVASVVDAWDTSEVRNFAAALEKNVIFQKTFVSESGSEYSPDYVPRRQTTVTVDIQQNTESVISGEEKTYAVSLKNKGEISVDFAMLSGHYLFGDENHNVVNQGSVVIAVSCAEGTSSELEHLPCPNWADGEWREMNKTDSHEHAHDHDHAHEGESSPVSVARFGNAFNGELDVPAQSELALEIRIKPSIPKGIDKLTDTMAVFFRVPWASGVDFSEESVMSADARGAVLAEKDEDKSQPKSENNDSNEGERQEKTTDDAEDHHHSETVSNDDGALHGGHGLHPNPPKDPENGSPAVTKRNPGDQHDHGDLEQSVHNEDRAATAKSHDDHSGSGELVRSHGSDHSHSHGSHADGTHDRLGSKNSSDQNKYESHHAHDKTAGSAHNVDKKHAHDHHDHGKSSDAKRMKAKHVDGLASTGPEGLAMLVALGFLFFVSGAYCLWHKKA